MCRWMAYSGNRIPMESLIFRPSHSLIDQSIASHSKETPTNADGFGLGWYGDRAEPGVFRSIRPAWNDNNLRDLASHISSGMFMAHVRAASQASVQETNCHPFRWGRWLFVHNGEIAEIEKIRRDLLMAVDDAYFSNIQGTTDSELMFHLALTLGLEHDPPGALSRMAGLIELTARRKGIAEALWMTVCVSDGKHLWAVRYASDGDAPTLYLSPEAEELWTLRPDTKDLFDQSARAIVSEPMGQFVSAWTLLPNSSVVMVAGAQIETADFEPAR